MTIKTIPFDSLGGDNHGWLDAKHHFSFANYHDPKRMGVGPLRVWNDDTIQPGKGFPFHSHQDMEIITFVREGVITHEDNLGNKGRTEAGDVQVMSAGTGITHSEYNLEDETTQIFQIWIMPNERGHKPRWAAKEFPKDSNAGGLVPLASGRSIHSNTDALLIHADAAVLGATMVAGQKVSHHLEAGRAMYIVTAKGAVTIDGAFIDSRDGAVITADGEDKNIFIEADLDAEIVIVDVPLN